MVVSWGTGEPEWQVSSLKGLCDSLKGSLWGGFLGAFSPFAAKLDQKQAVFPAEGSPLLPSSPRKKRGAHVDSKVEGPLARNLNGGRLVRMAGSDPGDPAAHRPRRRACRGPGTGSLEMRGNRG